MNHENDSNEAKLIIKMSQMDQDQWAECAKSSKISAMK